MARVAEEGRGVVVYLRGHEGRGIGLGHKLRAYTLAGRRPRHRRGQPRARLPGRLARVRHRRADPRRPRCHHDAADDQQPGEVRRHRGLRPRDRRAGPGAAPSRPRRTSRTCARSRSKLGHLLGFDPDSEHDAELAAADGGVREHEGALDATGMRFAIVAARFNREVTEPLCAGAEKALRDHGAAEVSVAWVPGAFELPLVAKRFAESGTVDAVVCIGAVIRGETAHFEYVAGECAAGRHARVARHRHPDRVRRADRRRPAAGVRPGRRLRRAQGRRGRRSPRSRWSSLLRAIP